MKATVLYMEESKQWVLPETENSPWSELVETQSVHAKNSHRFENESRISSTNLQKRTATEGLEVQNRSVLNGQAKTDTVTTMQQTYVSRRR